MRNALALAALSLGVLGPAGAPAAPGAAPARPRTEPPPLAHRISVDARGPLVLVEVTRELAPARTETGGVEAVVDLALPDGSVLAAVEVQDGGRWRGVDPATVDASHTGDLYRSESAARGVTPAVEPFDDSAAYRLRLARSSPGGASGGGARAIAPLTVRYRFAAAAAFSGGRHRLRFPAAPERLPTPAEVTVATRDATDVEIAGARLPAGASGTAAGRASTRSGWEISWAPRDPAPAGETVSVDARIATAALSPKETAVAYAVRSRAARPAAAPDSVLFLVDRSRSVGLAGLSAERDLARKLVEALPPSVRFDVLFFDRETKRLFPMSRPATREAIDAFEAEMVPSRLQNGTDLVAALQEAGALLRREQISFAPRALLAIITDGALPDRQDGAALDRALGKLPGLELEVAAFAVRPPDDDPVGPRARQALHALAGARGGVARELKTGEVGDVVPAALAELEHGGDLAALRLEADGHAHALAEALPPGGAVAGVITVAGRPPRAMTIEATAHGHRVTAAPHPTRVAGPWLRPWAAKPAPRILVGASLVALVEPVERAAEQSEPLVKGSMDRMVMRNVLSLAYMPRARACYLDRTGATAALRDLAGKVRLAIDVVRGEVEHVAIESSTLNHAEIERCLREGAFAIDVPRAVRSDAPVTAILNLVFRPRTPDKKPVSDLGAVGDQIDLIVEEAQRDAEKSDAARDGESASAAPGPGATPNPFPTR
jgi:hypothetical protein